MRVLVYSHVPLWTIHHAETVEICLRHLSMGDDVYLLSCDGALTSCPANPFHDEARCEACRGQTDWTLDAILRRKAADIRIPAMPEMGAPACFESIADLADYTEDGVPFGELVTSQLVADERDSYFPIDAHRGRIASLLQSAKHLYRSAFDIIKEHRVKKVYVWNGRRCSDGPVSFAARDCGVAFATYISGNKPSHYLTLPAPRVHDLDANKQRMAAIYRDALDRSPRSKIEEDARIFYEQARFGTGDFPGFIDFTTNFSDAKDFTTGESGKPMLAIYTSSFWEYFAMRDYRGGVYHNHYDGLEKMLTDDRIISNWDCHVRWHPNLATCGRYERARIQKIVDRTMDRSHHYLPESSVNSYKLLENAAAVVSFGSTVGVEACYYGKPSILLGRGLYEDLDVCYRPATHEEFVHLLATVPAPKSDHGTIVFGFYQRNRGLDRFEHLSHHGGWEFSYRGRALKAPQTGDAISQLKARFRHAPGIGHVWALWEFIKRSRGTASGHRWL
jgi:hypothetical protein